METCKIMYPIILSRELKNVERSFVIHLIKPQASTNNKVEILTHIAMLKRELFLKKKVWMKLCFDKFLFFFA